MPGLRLAIDTQLEYPRQSEGRADMKTCAGRCQVFDRACHLLSGRAILDEAAQMGGRSESLFCDQASSAIIVGGNNLSALCNPGCVRLDLDCARQHISPRPLAGVTDESIPLHGPDDGMLRYRNVHHDCPALGTMRSVVNSIARRHGLRCL